MHKFLKPIALLLAVALTATAFCGCSLAPENDPNVFSATMVTDTGGVNDGSFNQSAWAGLQRLRDEKGAKVNYTESKQVSDFLTNLDRSIDGGYDMIWGIGFDMADSVEHIARLNPNSNFGLIDATYDDIPENVCTVTFRGQDAAFIVGYIAALTTQSNAVGFIGGMHTSVIDQFEYGYKAGVAYGAKELGKEIDVQVQYAESYSDAAKAKQIALKMYSNGCDIIFHAAGQCGNGLFAAAQEQNKWAIGVDSDQSYLAPNNCLTSALKRVDNAVYEICSDMMDGEKVTGKHYEFGLAEDCVGIPEENPNLDPQTYEKAIAVEDMIKDGVISPPENEQQYNDFVTTQL